MATETVLETASRADERFKSIPIIDLQGVENDPILRRKIAKDIRDACINVGFFYIKNHGIPEERMANVIKQGERFFALPEETKLKYDSRKTTNLKGYIAMRSENIDPENRGDVHEAYGVIQEAKGAEQDAYGTNVWPTEIPEFKEEYMKYFDAATQVGKKMFPLFALALDLDEHFFEDKTKEGSVLMRLLHYPPQFGPHDDRLIGIGAHSDFECFTILYQQPGIQALQVLNANKEWVNAPPIPGTLVVNIGDQLMRWTNDIFKSNVHRAINRSGIERYAIPVFFSADYYTKIEPIPTCVSEECPPKYEMIYAGEYIKQGIEKSYASAAKILESEEK